MARQTGELLLGVRQRAIEARWPSWEVERVADSDAHDLLVEELARHRPGDAVLSEEGTDDPVRLTAKRVWIVDPLDGSADFASPGSPEFAVHVALVEGGRAVAGAVSLPARARLYGTSVKATPGAAGRERPVVLSGRGGVYAARAVARAIGGEWAVAGSAGFKAMAVVAGEADVYIHPTGLWEWDVCAPAAVAIAAGLHVSDLDGAELVFNQRRPVVRGLLVSRPEYAAAVLDLVG